MSNNTQTRIAEIKARAEAATPGPWRIEDNFQLENGCLCLCCHEYAGKNVTTDGPDLHEQDATFIAHARADIDWLVAEVERLQFDYDSAFMTGLQMGSMELSDLQSKAMEVNDYIARLEARLREALKNEIYSPFVDYEGLPDDYPDAEMAKLRESK